MSELLVSPVGLRDDVLQMACRLHYRPLRFELRLDVGVPLWQLHDVQPDAAVRQDKKSTGVETSSLDVGGDRGGVARLRASQYGCQVTVLDVTESTL
jgi:hypothetical protein